MAPLNPDLDILQIYDFFVATSRKTKEISDTLHHLQVLGGDYCLPLPSLRQIVKRQSPAGTHIRVRRQKKRLWSYIKNLKTVWTYIIIIIIIIIITDNYQRNYNAQVLRPAGLHPAKLLRLSDYLHLKNFCKSTKLHAGSKECHLQTFGIGYERDLSVAALRKVIQNELGHH